MLRALLLLIASALPAAAQPVERVDLELVLLADATGSIDDTEILLQRQGYAEAMVDPQVLWAIDNGGAEASSSTTIQSTTTSCAPTAALST